MIKNHVKIAFAIALILLSHISIFSMEEKPKKPVVSSEIVFLKWLEKKMSSETTLETLTPEGLAYILHCFPKDMLYEIGRHLKVPERDLIAHLPICTYSGWYKRSESDITSAEWFPGVKILRLHRRYGTWDSHFNHRERNFSYDNPIPIDPPANTNDQNWVVAWRVSNGAEVLRYLQTEDSFFVVSRDKMQYPIDIFIEHGINRAIKDGYDPKNILSDSVIVRVSRVDLSRLPQLRTYIQNIPLEKRLSLLHDESSYGYTSLQVLVREKLSNWNSDDEYVSAEE